VRSHFRQSVREVLRAGQAGQLDLYLELIHVNDVFMLLPVEAVVDGIYYCANEGFSTGLPAAKAQKLEDSNDGGIVQVRYFDAVIVGTMPEVTHVQSDSLNGRPRRVRSLTCLCRAMDAWLCRVRGLGRNLSRDANRTSNRRRSDLCRPPRQAMPPS
jgi:hypothetical protein